MEKALGEKSFAEIFPFRKKSTAELLSMKIRGSNRTRPNVRILFQQLEQTN